MIQNNIRSIYNCDVELLTPLHIGSGDKYVENFDFSYDRKTKKLLVFNRNKLLKQVAEAGEKTIQSFTRAIEEEYLTDWLKKKTDGVDLGAARIHSFISQKGPRDIHVQLRNGIGDALLAGSSLKGAFRTAVLSRLSKEEGRRTVGQCIKNFKGPSRVNLKFADNGIAKNLLGRDAQKNLMRSLTVADCVFSPETIKLQSVLLSRLIDGGKMKVKFDVVVEKILEGSKGSCQVSFDSFLGEHGQGKLGLKTALTSEWLLDAIRQKTAKTIVTELDFFDGLPDPHSQQMLTFYRQLESRIAALGHDEVILQLAWGSGWNGMTGELMEQEELNSTVRSKLQLASKYIKFPFPKSRRFAEVDGHALPMGWVKLTFTDKALLKARAAEKLEKHLKEQAQALAEKEAAELEKTKWSAMAGVERDVAVIRGDTIALSQEPDMHPIRDIWPKIDNAEPPARVKLAEAFIRSWQDSPDLWRKKHCSVGQWEKVEKVVEITKCNHPDIQTFGKEEQAMIDLIESCNDFGQFAGCSIDFNSMPLSVAELLVAKLKAWGCDNRRASRKKKQTWKDIHNKLRELRKNQ